MPPTATATATMSIRWRRVRSSHGASSATQTGAMYSSETPTVTFEPDRGEVEDHLERDDEARARTIRRSAAGAADLLDAAGREEDDRERDAGQPHAQHDEQAGRHRRYLDERRRGAEDQRRRRDLRVAAESAVVRGALGAPLVMLASRSGSAPGAPLVDSASPVNRRRSRGDRRRHPGTACPWRGRGTRCGRAAEPCAGRARTSMSAICAPTPAALPTNATRRVATGGNRPRYCAASRSR